MKRRLFSAILSLIMLLSLVPMTVFADTSTTYVKATVIEDGAEYLLVGTGTNSYAVKNNSGSIEKLQVTLENDTVSTDDANCVWTASVGADGKATLSNGGQYLQRYQGEIKVVSAVADASQWSYDGTKLSMTSSSGSTYYLGYRSSKFSMSTTDDAHNVLLYKKTSTTGGGSEEPETGALKEATTLEDGSVYLIVVNGRAMVAETGDSYTTSTGYRYEGLKSEDYTNSADDAAKITADMLWQVEVVDGKMYIKNGSQYLNGSYATVGSDKVGSVSLGAKSDSWTLSGKTLKSAAASTSSGKYLEYGNTASTGSGTTNETFSVRSTGSKLTFYKFEGTLPGGDVEPVTYTVTFNMKDHGAAIAAQTVAENGKATKPADPTAEGYIFDGWYANEGCTEAFDFNSAINADTTVYAKWTKGIELTPNATTPDSKDVSIDVDESFTVRVKNASTRSSYTFNASFSKSGVAGVNPETVENVAASATCDFVITGVKDGETVVTIANDNKDSQRKAIINLKVGAGEQPEAGALAEATTLEDGSVYLIVANGKAMVATDGGYYENNNGEYRYSGLASKAYANSEEDAAAITADMLWQIEVDGGKMYIKNGNQYLNATYSKETTPKGGSVSLGAKSDSWTLSNNELKSATAGKSLEYGNNGGTASTIFAARSTGSKLTFYKFEGTLPGGDVEPVTYTVTFNMKDHGAAVAAQTVTEGNKATKPATDPTAEGYTFGGWYADENCTEEFNFDTAITANTTVYAKWTKNPEIYTVSFNMNGHGEAIEAQTVTENGKATKPATDPTAEGYTFGGWYADESFNTVFNFDAVIAANTTVYAKWTKNPDTYTVNFEMNGHGVAVAAQTVTEGNKATRPTAPTEEGYTFGGWFADEDFTTVFDFDAAITADTTVYVKWTKNPDTYTVTFNMNGHGTDATQPVVEGSKATKPATDPTAEGYTFGGWYADENCTEEFNFDTAITANTTVYAKWTKNPEIYTVSFNMNGHGAAVAAQTVTEGNKATKPADPTEEGYTFGGWYADESFTTAFNFDAVIAANTTVYAKWTKNPAPVTDITYLAFTSDVHNSNGNTSATRLNTWLNTVSGKLDNAKFADMGMCGDMANAGTSESNYWSLAKTTMDTVMNNGNVTGTGFFVCGNHEWSPGNFGSTSSDQKARIKVAGSYDEQAAYVLYSLGATSSSDSGTGIKSADITALENYLKTAPTDRPIFVLSHFPLHSYGGRSTANAAQVISVLNAAAKNGHTIIFLWGHNHTMSDSNYDKVITDKIGSTNISFTYAAAGCMSDSDYGGGSGSVKGKGLVATINGTNVELTYYNANGGIVASGMANVGGNGGEDPIVPTDPTGDVVYKLVNGFELGKTYLIVSVNDGQGKVLNSDLSTPDVTVTDGKVTVSNAMTRAEWKVDTSVNGRLGLYNGSKVLKINASDANNPVITTEDSYNYGGFTYTNNHFVYPYGGGAGAETNYYFGVKNGNFVASATENGLGEVYLFEKVESGSQGGEDNPPATDKVVSLTPSTDKPSKDVTIKVGESFTVALTNGSTSSAYDFNTTFSKSGIASASPSTVNIAKSATENIVITGDAVGTTTITFSNSNTYGSQYTRIATINLTVTGEGGEEPIDPPATDKVVELTPSTDKPSQNVTIKVGESFTVALTNGSTQSAYDFTTSFSKSGIASASADSVNIGKGETKNIVITGNQAGTVTITFSNSNTYGSQYTRIATINLTVTGEGGEEPIDPPATDDVVELTPVRNNTTSVSKTIAVGESFTVALTNSSENSAYDFNTSFSKSGIASATPSTVNVAMGGTENIVITGVKAGTTTITFSNTNSYDSSYNRTATINLTVTGEGGEDPITPPAPSGDVTYVAFSSDVHNGSGNVSSADRLNGWINKVTTINNAPLDNMGFCGDMGPASGSADSFWNNAQTVMNTVANNSNVLGDGFYVCGNHEYNPGSYTHDRNATTQKYSEAGTALETADYIFYSLGARQWDEIYSDADIEAMSEFLSAHSDFDGPIFILSHFPLHSYSSGGYGYGFGGGSTSGESSGIHDGRPAVGSAKIINVLNEYPNVIYLWGHNHSSSNDHYDAVYTDKINDTEINFTYAAAGCMSDSEYGSSGNVKGKGLVAAIYDDSVVLTYYGVNGNEVGTGATIPMSGSSTPATTYTITASAGENGSISPNGAVEVKEGRSKTFTFAPDAGYEVDTVLVNGEAVPVSGNSYTMANVSDDATISVSFKKIQGTAYTLATEMKAGKYILVSNGYALYNDNGKISAVPVTVSGDTVIISDSNVAGATWTFSAAAGADKSGDYVVKSGDYYFSRVSDSSGSSVAAEITKEQKNSEASGLPYYQWSYDVANGQLSHIGGQDKSATFYAYYDTSANAFYTASSEQSLKLYVVDATQPEHQHSFGDWTVAQEATCTEKGTEQRTCSCGEVETREIDALGHDIVHHDAKAATCTEGGWEAYDTCSRCDYSTYAAIEALGHDFGEWTAVTAATCTDKGMEQRTCSCGEVETREIEALGHNYKPVVTAPTCTKDGYTTYTCENCNHSYKSDYTDALGHSYKAEVTAPTCTAAGYTTYTCENCSNSYKSDYTDALGHNYGAWESINETQHQHVCANDASHVVIANHIFSGDTCVDCGYTKAAAGYSFSGSVKSFGDEKDTITIQLLKDGQVVYTTTVTGNDTTYAFDAVADGNYTLKATKHGHAMSQYDVIVNGEVKQNVELWLRGDVNEDGEVTDADAVYLLYNTFFGDEEYPIEQPCDFNGDGEVTDADAVYLLYYTFFGDEDYPLH